MHSILRISFETTSSDTDCRRNQTRFKRTQNRRKTTRNHRIKQGGKRSRAKVGRGPQKQMPPASNGAVWDDDDDDDDDDEKIVSKTKTAMAKEKSRR
mmetsp:Transcript_20951/g.49620  ORF Transcript_20951/g.49620 Transcript_20951/m.49620 type:complete len:97 (+) Transcript_20951:38-328(+)